MVKNATQEYRRDQDVLANFLSAMCIENPDLESPARELYSAYKAWIEETNEWPMNEHTFSNALTERGYKRVRHSSGVVWKGIATLASQAPC